MRFSIGSRVAKCLSSAAHGGSAAVWRGRYNGERKLGESRGVARSAHCAARGVIADLGRQANDMAARKKKTVRRGGRPAELIISKARTKAATKKCNVGGEFYEALDKEVRKLIAEAEARAVGNKRKTLKAVDL